MTVPAGDSFGAYVRRARGAGQLVVQPRMGFSDPAAMRAGLLAVRAAPVTAAGTVTVDSYTRLGLHGEARRALNAGVPLNGYPIVAHGGAVNRSMLAGVPRPGFPVQVRHGSAQPGAIVRAMRHAGLHATEGGPVSYCLPYGRVPLRQSIANWERACELLTRAPDGDTQAHLETFGGGMMGQLCPPGLLVATSILEALFFRQHGLRSVSLSYAQQTSPAQDRLAVRALAVLGAELLADIDWHIVVYAYMGLYPRTGAGARRLLRAAAALAVQTGAARLIVKTTAEAHRIPTVAENVEALRIASLAAARVRDTPAAPQTAENEVLREARTIVAAVLGLHDDVGRALLRAVTRGHFDVPYCLHPDNHGRTRSYVAPDGWLRWSRVGGMPIDPPPGPAARAGTTAAQLLTSLSYTRDTFDAAGASRPTATSRRAGTP
ncbi:methylaspartate mutase [Dactylosporangium sp. CA-139114]|uniref:methylaspartate mutase n=1 Tax=Dactylosporangium sp. CA-139114 TaxID=3239931 RepID=UPI003D9621C8